MDSDISRDQYESRGFVRVLEKETKMILKSMLLNSEQLRKKIKLLFAKAVLYCRSPF